MSSLLLKATGKKLGNEELNRNEEEDGDGKLYVDW
jgi:hypothetical protein